MKEKWAFAFADGKKWVEIQRYSKHNLNLMRFAKPGTWILLGISKQITALAICSGAASRRHSDMTVLQDPALVHESQHADVGGYLNGAVSFDYLLFGSICDLTDNFLRWTNIWAMTGAQRPCSWQGFPRVGGSQLAAQLWIAAMRRNGRWKAP